MRIVLRQVQELEHQQGNGGHIQGPFRQGGAASGRSVQRDPTGDQYLALAPLHAKCLQISCISRTVKHPSR